MKRPFTIKMEVLLYKFVAGAASVWPLWGLQAAGKHAGVVYFLISRRRRSIALENLARVFPTWSPQKRYWTGLRCGAHFGRIAFDYLKWTRASESFIRKRVRIKGLEHLRAALDRGKGAFILSAHFGHWEVGALALSLAGYPQVMIHRPLDNPVLETALAARRTRFGNTLIPKRGALRGILRSLHDGGLVDILIDQKSTEEPTCTSPFLGVRTPTVTSLARMVRTTGAAVVPLFARPSGTGYAIELQPPLVMGGAESDEAFTTMCNALLTAAILRDPHLWLWFHNRWRT